MTYVLEGAEGTVTSWGVAGFYNTLLSKLMPNRATLNILADQPVTTQLGAFVQAAIPGLRSFEGSISSMVKFGTGGGRLGNVGLMTWSAGGYTTHAYSWDLTIESIGVHDVTNLAAAGSGPTWRAFRPSSLRATGTYRARVDDLTAIVAPHASDLAGVLPTFTLKFGDEASDDTIVFTGGTTGIGGIIGSARINQAVGEPTTVEYDFVASGAITPDGTSNPLGTSALSTGPLWSQGGATANTLLTLTAGTGRTYVGDAFYKSIRIHCEVGEPVSFEVDFQGNGALTIA
jgi:hypothetical protein